jgi:hypothetical protein
LGIRDCLRFGFGLCDLSRRYGCLMRFFGGLCFKSGDAANQRNDRDNRGESTRFRRDEESHA